MATLTCPAFGALGAVLALALAGCPLNHSSTLAMSSTTPASSSSASSSSASTPPSASPTSSSAGDTVDGPRTGVRSRIVRSQLETLIGMTPDEARAQLKKFGHDGEVTLGVVTDYGGGQRFDKACGVNRVCETSDGSGTGIHDSITLYLNPTLTIAPPPE